VSANDWEEAARTAIEEAGRHVRDLRIAEIEKLDLRIENNKLVEFRARDAHRVEEEYGPPRQPHDPTERRGDHAHV
jgi:hypothetical protein